MRAVGAVVGRAIQFLRSQWKLLWSIPVGRAMLVAAAATMVATVIGLVLLWPASSTDAPANSSGQTDSAEVVAITSLPCGAGTCRYVEVELLSGRDRGRSSLVALSADAPGPEYSVRQRVRVLAATKQPGFEEGDRPPPSLPGALPDALPPAVYSYSIVDYDRRTPIVWLAVIFAILAVAAARLRGLLALVGLATSMVIVSQFVVPAMLDQSSPFLVALVGSLAAMFVTIGLTSGLSVQSLAASLGIAGSLLFAATLGLIYVNVAHLDGSGSELAFTLRQGSPGLSLQGLVLAGMVIGALGVLADTAVTQASAVMALRRANPALGFAAVYREAFTIGRDHLSATVHTLVFAYVGASLPLLLLFETGGVNFTDAFNNQAVSEPVVATLVGAIGIISCVPLTTGLAAALATALPADAIPATEHHHH